MDAELCGMQGGVHENVIDREGGEAGGKGAKCPCWPDECSHVTQVPGNDPMGARSAHAVEISEQNCRFIRRDGAEPCRPDEQSACNWRSLTAETEMTVDNVHRTEIGLRLDPNCNTLLAAIPGRHTGHLIGALQRDRETAHDGVPILLVPAAHRGMKMIFPAELRGDQRRLVGT